MFMDMRDKGAAQITIVSSMQENGIQEQQFVVVLRIADLKKDHHNFPNSKHVLTSRTRKGDLFLAVERCCGWLYRHSLSNQGSLDTAVRFHESCVHVCSSLMLLLL